MGLTRSELFTDKQNEIAHMFRVLAHPARIAILQYLARMNRCMNTTLVHELGLAQATISQHLRELKEAGLVKGTIEGTSMNYCIDLQRWTEVKAMVEEVFDESDKEKGGNCC